VLGGTPDPARSGFDRFRRPEPVLSRKRATQEFSPRVIAGIPPFATQRDALSQNTKGFLEDAREALARHFAWLGSGVA
jgi:hypothetical protein